MDNDNALAVIAPSNLDEAQRMADLLSKSPLVPEIYRNNPANTLFALLTGRELGMAPMQSLRGIYSFKGKPSLYAETMVALVKASPNCEFFTLVESTATKATYRTKRKGAEPVTMTYTIEQATRAGSAGTNDNYKRNPEDMLRARCASKLCRAEYPDVTLGLRTPEELAEIVENDPPPEGPPSGTRAEEVLRMKLKPVAQDASFVPASPPDVTKALGNVPPHVTEAPPPVPPPSPAKQHRAPIVDVPSPAPAVKNVLVDGKSVPMVEATTPQLEAALERGKKAKQTPEVVAGLAAITAELAMRAEAMKQEFGGEPGGAA